MKIKPKENSRPDGLVNYTFLLLCFYFILFQLNRYFGLVPFLVCVKFLLIYTAIGFTVFFIGMLIFKSRIRSSLYTLIFLSIYLFFGAYHDFIKSKDVGFISSYKFTLPAICFVLIMFLIILSKANITALKNVRKFSFMMFLILFLWESVFLLYNIITSSQRLNDLGDKTKTMSRNYQPCDTCSKPDIFFIVFDGFTSSLCAREEFDYDNSHLDSFLTRHGFYMVDSSNSNYAVTPFSIASTLNLNYLDSTLPTKELDGKLLMRASISVTNSEFPAILKKEGYVINNYSVFDLADHPVKREYFDFFEESLINSQTLAGRINKDIAWNFRTKNIFTGKKRVPEFFFKNRAKHLRDFVNQNIEGVYQVLNKKSDIPQFTYSHMMQPHEPFFFKRDGTFQAFDSILPGSVSQMKARYLDQLIYATSKLKSLVDSIMIKTKGNSIIIIQGDHGFRDFETTGSRDKIFRNLNCYYFPDRDYSKLYKSITPVNTFRVVADKYFGKNYPMLRDSTVYIKNIGFYFERKEHAN